MSKRQGDVLAEIILDNEYERIAEIGVWKSHTVQKILSSAAEKIIKEYWGVDWWLRPTDPIYGHYHTRTQEKWDQLYLKACKLMHYFPQFRVLRASSLEAAKIFPEKYFDLVFIDSDHFYEPLKQDIESWLPLIRKGGMLSGHDYGNRRFPGCTKAVDECFGKDNITLYDCHVWAKKV
jgi:hypothetical protein